MYHVATRRSEHCCIAARVCVCFAGASEATAGGVGLAWWRCLPLAGCDMKRAAGDKETHRRVAALCFVTPQRPTTLCTLLSSSLTRISTHLSIPQPAPISSLPPKHSHVWGSPIALRAPSHSTHLVTAHRPLVATPRNLSAQCSWPSPPPSSERPHRTPRPILPPSLLLYNALSPSTPLPTTRRHPLTPPPLSVLPTTPRSRRDNGPHIPNLSRRRDRAGV